MDNWILLRCFKQSLNSNSVTVKNTWILLRNFEKSIINPNSIFLKTVGYLDNWITDLKSLIFPTLIFVHHRPVHKILWLSKIFWYFKKQLDTWIIGYYLEVLRSLSIQILSFSKTVGYLDNWLEITDFPYFDFCSP